MLDYISILSSSFEEEEFITFSGVATDSVDNRTLTLHGLLITMGFLIQLPPVLMVT